MTLDVRVEKILQSTTAAIWHQDPGSNILKASQMFWQKYCKVEKAAALHLELVTIVPASVHTSILRRTI